MAFKYADAYIDMSLKDDSVITGLRKVDDALAKVGSSTEEFNGHLAKVASHGAELSRSLGGIGSVISDVLQGFAVGGAAGAGMAAISEVIPVVVDGVSKMGEAFGFSNKNIVDHAKALEIATNRAKEYSAAAKEANEAWGQHRDRLMPGEAEAGAGKLNDPKTSVDDALAKQNAAIGAAQQRLKDLQSGKADELLKQGVLNRLNGGFATDDQIKAQVARERAKAIAEERGKLGGLNNRRDELIWQQFQERDRAAFNRDEEMRRAADNRAEEENQRAADEAKRKGEMEAERKRRLAEQAGTFVPGAIGMDRERFPGLGASAAPAFSAQRGDIGSMWSAIQQGISNGEGLRLQKEAAEAAKNANNLLKDVNANAAKMVDKLDKLNIQARAQ